MPIQNKTVTILGSTAKLSNFTIYPQDDGTFRVSINGTVSDGGSFVDQISATGSYGAGVAPLVNMAAAALTKLRTDNGFET
jgi:hypothetical protein